MTYGELILETIDESFIGWYNQAQPFEQITQNLDKAGDVRLTVHQISAVRSQLKHAFTHGYARGVAAEVAKFGPEDPERGPVR